MSKTKKKDEIKAEELEKIKESSPAPLVMVDYARFLESITTYQQTEDKSATTIVKNTEIRLDKVPKWIDVKQCLKDGMIEIVQYPKGTYLTLLITVQHTELLNKLTGQVSVELYPSGTAWAYEQVPKWINIKELLAANQAVIVEY